MSSGNGSGSRFAGRFAWALYDWANSAYATVILTFVFSAYFARQVAPDDSEGMALWGYAMGIAGLAVALAGPVLGAIADRAGRRKPWLAVFTALCVLGIASLWLVRPDPGWVVPALVLAGIAAFGADAALIFYNAMLADIVPRDRVGRWSGWAWGLGYAGGLTCLVIVLFGFARGDAWFGLPKEEAAHLRAAFLFVAAWYAVFALPLFALTPDREKRQESLGEAVRGGVRQLRETLAEARRYKRVGLFLLARLLYIDGLATVFALGGAFAAGVFDMTETDLLAFGIVLNVTAGLGALAFSWLTDRLGDHTTLVIALVSLIAASSAMLASHAELWFWIFGAVFGIFVGPVQSASRSYLARLAPEKLRTQFFGLYAFSGKATAFAGPLLVGAITHWSGNQRIGMSIVVVLFLAGLGMLTIAGRYEPHRE